MKRCDRTASLRRFLWITTFCTMAHVGVTQNLLDIDSLLTLYPTQTDTTQLRTINHIVNYYMYRDIEQAQSFAYLQLQRSDSLGDPTATALAHYQVAHSHYNLDQLDSARHHYVLSLELGKEVDNAIFISQAYRGLAILEFSQGNLDETDSINSLDLAHCTAQQDTMGMALARDFKGTINQNRGYYAIALTHVLEGLRLFELIGDSIRIADALNHLATLEYNFENFDQSIAYNQRALRIYEVYEDHYYQAQALNDIGVGYKSLGLFEEALDFFERSIHQAQVAQVSAIEAAALSNIGGVHLKLDDPVKAIEFLRQSIQMSESINAQRRIAIARNQLAEVYLALNNPQQALSLSRQVIDYAEATTSLSIHSLALKHGSRALEMLGQTASALELFREYKTLSDTILNKEKVKTIEELRVIHETEQNEAALALQDEEIRSLNAQARADQQTKRLYGGGMVAFFAISGLMFFGFRQRMKKNRIEREKREALYHKELEHKKKELASQTLHLVQKNVFIQELKDNLEQMRESPEKFKVEFRRIVTLLKKENASDKNWEIFKSFFVDVHNDFDKKLREMGDISESEMRLAAFLRMNLTTKEIAALLNVLPDSILKSKYRLKKKLGLAKDTDLVPFLNGLS